MKKKGKKQFGVWMDSKSAIVTGRQDVDEGDFVVLGNVGIDDSGVYNSEHTANNAAKTETKKFFKSITTHMQNAEEIYVTGPGKIQEQFIHYLQEEPQFKKAETSHDTSEKLGEEKLIQVVTEKFG